MAGIFISYRQADAKGWAISLRDDLADVFGNDQVFLDKDNLRAGNWREQIQRELKCCKVVLVIIGPSWLTIADEHDRPRIELTDDVHHQEVSQALRRSDLTVIPVLVGEAPMPRKDQLPADLQELAEKQARKIGDTQARRKADLAGLVDDIKSVGKIQPKPAGGSDEVGSVDDYRHDLQWRWFFLGAFFLLVAVGFAAWGFYLRCLSQDQQRILQWALPIASGFMAWTFAGSLTARGRSLVAGLAIFATGGFAVWLITTYALFPKIASDPDCRRSACSEARPCVDIFRLVDFTRSTCLSDGSKFDLVLIDDTYILDPPHDRYSARANRMVMQNQQLRVFDLSSSDTIPIPVVDGGAPGPEAEQLMFSAKFVNGKARVRYEWRNTFPGEKKEGISFLSNYRIRDIHVELKLPPAVSIDPESVKFVVPEKAKTMCDHFKKECKALYVDTEVELHWTWNMWEGCRSALASASG